MLTKAEDSFHLFQWLAKGRFGPVGSEEDRKAANLFYDQEVTIRYRALEIIGTSDVARAAHDVRRRLNDLRHLLNDVETLPPTGEKRVRFEALEDGYRDARDRFIVLARAELEPKTTKPEGKLDVT